MSRTGDEAMKHKAEIQETNPSGTLYPLHGKPHLPSMCAYRITKRSNHTHSTKLCYDLGIYEVIGPFGPLMIDVGIQGQFKLVYCEKHGTVGVRRYRSAMLKRLNTGDNSRFDGKE